MANLKGNGVMADQTVVTGGSFPFHVECRNASGRLVVPKDCTVSTPEVVIDPPGTGSIGSASVDPDGSNGIFTSAGPLGSINIIATAGGVTSPPFMVEVVDDTVIASVTVVSDAIQQVRIKQGR